MKQSYGMNMYVAILRARSATNRDVDTAGGI